MQAVSAFTWETANSGMQALWVTFDPADISVHTEFHALNLLPLCLVWGVEGQKEVFTQYENVPCNSFQRIHAICMIAENS